MSDTSTTIGKGALAARLSARLGIPRAQAEEAIEETLFELARALGAGEGVSLRGFGTFRLHHQPARAGSVAGTDYTSPARTVVKFRPGRELADRVAGLDLS